MQEKENLFMSNYDLLSVLYEVDVHNENDDVILYDRFRSPVLLDEEHIKEYCRNLCVSLFEGSKDDPSLFAEVYKISITCYERLVTYQSDNVVKKEVIHERKNKENKKRS